MEDRRSARSHENDLKVRVEVWVPLAWSVCIVSQHDSALEHFSVRRGFAAVLAANWPSSRPSVAAQKMRGWWSLTITTKAGSVQPAMLGGATGPLPWGRWAV